MENNSADSKYSPDALANGTVRYLLLAEGAAVMLASLIAYGQLSASWGTFALWFLLPDLSMLAYLAGPRAGAASYNAAHSYIGPMLVGVLAITVSPGLAPIALIWAAHIGMDRMLGYGLKAPHAFSSTHLGVIGQARRNQ